MKRLMRLCVLCLIVASFGLGMWATLADAKGSGPNVVCELFCEAGTHVLYECCWWPSGKYVCTPIGVC